MHLHLRWRHSFDRAPTSLRASINLAYILAQGNQSFNLTWPGASVLHCQTILSICQMPWPKVPTRRAASAVNFSLMSTCMPWLASCIAQRLGPRPAANILLLMSCFIVFQPPSKAAAPCLWCRTSLRTSQNGPVNSHPLRFNFHKTDEPLPGRVAVIDNALLAFPRVDCWPTSIQAIVGETVSVVTVLVRISHKEDPRGETPARVLPSSQRVVHPHLGGIFVYLSPSQLSSRTLIDLYGARSYFRAWSPNPTNASFVNAS